MAMSEKEWATFAAARGLDGTTGSKIPEPEYYQFAEADIETRNLLRHIRDEVKALTVIAGIGFTVLAAIGLIK